MTDLVDHLQWWGLRRFDSDSAYFQWQREALSASEITHLNQLVEEKRIAAADVAHEVAFYNFTARPHILPVLYSQRYDYYMALGPLVADRIEGARSVLDFGCGPGILSTFYARQFPDIRFVGIDRSDASVRAAQQRASALGLTNLRFEKVDVEHTTVPGTYDLIVSTHALLQSEADPGIPSATWETFNRPSDQHSQDGFEERTGLCARLDALCRALTPHGRLIMFEKTRQLARRVPFQRALSARGFELLEPPLLLHYLLVEEVADDGPFYVVASRSAVARSGYGVPWEEAPEYRDEDELYRCDNESARSVWERLPDRFDARVESWEVPTRGSVRAERGKAAGALSYLYLSAGNRVIGLLVGGQAAVDAMTQNTEGISAFLQCTKGSSASPPDLAGLPLYENHTVTAQFVWSRLSNREILQTTTLDGPGGRQMHVELGRVPHLRYLYWANTFDQRQLVIVEESRAPILEQYYQEFLDTREAGSTGSFQANRSSLTPGNLA